MQWFNPITNLQYYNRINGVPCYYEQLVHPSDLMLQGGFTAGSGNYSLLLEVYTVDGVTLLENATTYFDYYFATNPYTGEHMFTARLKAYSPQMCAKQCFIIKATVTDTSKDLILFLSYTEQYKVHDCCDVPRGITIGQTGLSTTILPVPIPQSPVRPTGQCGEPLIRLISYFDCYDDLGNNIYTETEVLSGVYFQYQRVSNFKGRLVKRPYEITIQYSYNCVKQRIESSTVYLLDGFEYFPTYKMDEITQQLRSQHVFVDDYVNYREYQYLGGTPFGKVDGAPDCVELFKLSAQLNDCTKRITLGCDVGCVTSASSTTYYVIPAGYAGGSFYSDNGALIANDYEGLLLWFTSQTGVTSVVDQSLACLDCDIQAAAEIVSTSSLPSIYYDIAVSRNKIYPISISDFCEICGVIGSTGCLAPVITSLTIEDAECNAPTVTSLTIEDVTPEVVDVFSYDPWVVSASPDSEGAVTGAAVTLDIKSKNNTTIIGLIGEEVSVSNVTIGTLSANGRPAVQTIIDSSSNPSVPAGVSVAINPDGTVTMSGTFTLTVDNELEVTFTNLLYNL